jgi:Tol biopolymer transport system component
MNHLLRVNGRRGLRIAALVSTSAAFATVAVAPVANATYPGEQGRLAFGADVDGGQPDIYTVRPNGHGVHRLTDDPGFDACPAYSADGKWIAWCRQAQDPAGQTDVWVMRANGTDKHRVTTLGGNALFPDFSPDGSQIVFNGRPAGATSNDIYVVGSGGGPAHKLTTSPGNDILPAWSPDGSQIAFLSNRTGTMQVWAMNADGTNQHALTTDARVKDQLPDWSPDGTRIAYVVDTAPVGGDIWLMNANGSNQHPINTGPSARLGTAWSPDGTAIAYLNWNTRTVEIINADGSKPRVVKPLGNEYAPAWQPLGREVH